MEYEYYILATNLRKMTDRSHYVNQDNPHRPGKPYWSREELIEKLEFNNICVQQMWELDYTVIKDNLLFVIVPKGDLEDRMKELVDKSVFRIMMRTGKPEFPNKD